MARVTKSTKSVGDNSALGFEAMLWAIADKLRGNLDHLAPTGLAGFVLASGSMSSNHSGEVSNGKAPIRSLN